MCSHVVNSVANLAEGLIADGASQTLTATTSIALPRVGLGQDCHDLFKFIVSGFVYSSGIYLYSISRSDCIDLILFKVLLLFVIALEASK